ncbi:isochorismatase family protein [Actinomadura sp. DC4]|uniref:cysteine hydrolase family protein n=1 Tax=Actinomadura sp. DC4 TaxID=3055069 RepID=UPI0025AF6A12|nr:isochorismatase family protein [Actinomadura sp. DC4]MDN3356134.1 isochorismatase family protein [Actinomadura sp. DC4]
MPRTALLAMDLKAGHLARTPADYLPYAVGAIETARAAGVPVIHVALRLRPGHAGAHPRNKIFGALPHHRYTAGDPDAAIHPDVFPADGEIVVHKNRVSAFAGNDLGQILAAQGVEHLRLRAHVEIMRDYRNRGTLRTRTWQVATLDRPDLLRALTRG